ncbi:dTDP-4-dehydrorhamnose reductase [Streptomyces natalensis]|uniref:dTDP-4-dehydrorhamnose reductase n=1 Tax=Streptomyces natalensis ATCC 27448 TaxID=1240678 RepID=A0A0D7CI69_9ACTN|nr:dTDP-4-dehydrorhamnose reductase [Streptomyces natalensis]KIZ15888.1 dTDP-4-dehydrorhamnose reductase [Streptomyces natalensis ATCC 27448]
MVVRWLVTGAGGLLGRDVCARLARLEGTEVTGLLRRDLDITQARAVRAALHAHRPDMVVNCAAWTAVDDAETHEDAAAGVNGDGPRHLAEACAESGARLLHLSTNYVFSGDPEGPRAETDRPGPRNAYGRSKLAGEQAVLAGLPHTGYVVRTAWLFGAGGRNFVRTMIRMERERDHVQVVDDQRGQPTWTVDLADLLVRLGLGALRGTAPAGVYHGTSRGATTWHSLAQETFRLLGADPGRVESITSQELARPAARPAHGVLGHAAWRAAGIEPIRHWRAALTEAFPALLAAERQRPPGTGP